MCGFNAQTHKYKSREKHLGSKGPKRRIIWYYFLDISLVRRQNTLYKGYYKLP